MTLYLVGCIGLALHRLLETFWHYLQYRVPRRCADIRPIAGELPMITVQLPVYNEFYVVERLIDGCCALDYPKDRLEIQVLDDSTDATTELIARMVAHYVANGVDIKHLRRGDRTGFKAGNLQHGLKTAKGAFVAIFDADFVPDRNFLFRTLPYFQDPAIGIVYPRFVRHRNRNRSLLTRAQDPHGGLPRGRRDLDYYYTTRFFSFFFGSPGLLRTSCLLDVGGWQGDTVCEDADFSVRSYLKGWRCVLVDERLSSDDVLERIDEIKHQYTRWKTGNAECYRKHLGEVIRNGTIAPLEKLALFAALHAPWLYVPSIAILAIASVPLVFRPEGGWASQVALVIPSLIISLWFVIVIAKGQAIMVVSMFLQIGLHPRVTWGIIKGLLGIHSPFVRSTKLNRDTGASHATAAPLYPVRVTPSILLEFGLALYFLFGIYWGVRLGNYWLLPFHLLCMCSFGFVFVTSVREVLAGIRRSDRRGLLEA